MDELYQYNDELYHHGVKGMKWGVRKKRESGGDGDGKTDKTTTKPVPRAWRRTYRNAVKDANHYWQADEATADRYARAVVRGKRIRTGVTLGVMAHAAALTLSTESGRELVKIGASAVGHMFKQGAQMFKRG